jgi:hypothetical protein
MSVPLFGRLAYSNPMENHVHTIVIDFIRAGKIVTADILVNRAAAAQLSEFFNYPA